MSSLHTEYFMAITEGGGGGASTCKRGDTSSLHTEYFMAIIEEGGGGGGGQQKFKWDKNSRAIPDTTLGSALDI